MIKFLTLTVVPRSRLIVLLVATVLWLGGCEPKPPPIVTVSGNTMGTTYSVKVVGANVDRDKLQNAVQMTVDRINQLMSNYKDDSELSLLNRSALDTRFPVSNETREVLALSAEIHALSDGAFDISLGPVVELWGFGPAPTDLRVPPTEVITEALSQTGTDGLVLGDVYVQRTRDISLDLSAIAKGYAVDQVAQMLDSEGYKDYLVEIGGELKGLGTNQANNPWRIAIELPDSTKREMYSVIELRNLGMATSGDYRNYFEVDGKRYSHTIDPATGMPITHNLASVTVLDASAARADGLATAINVMGAEKGIALANAQNIPIMVIMKGAEGFVAKTSKAFDKYVSTQ